MTGEVLFGVEKEVGFKRGLSRGQSSLLPASIEDYVGADNVVRVIDAYVEGLDVSGLGFVRSQPRATGRPGYAPGDMLKLYIYGYWHRVRSSRRLEAECGRNVELMWLLGQLVPDHKTIAEFRRCNAKALKAACGEFVGLVREAGLLGGQVVAVDGTKFKANASRSSLFNAQELVEAQAKVGRRIERYLEELDQADGEEGAEGAVSAEAIEAALKRLRAREQKLGEAQERLEAGRGQGEGEGTPRVGLTDADCVMLKVGGRGSVAGYNVQQAVDAKHKLIVAHEVYREANDSNCLEPMAGLAKEVLGVERLTVVVDTGYMNGAQAQACEAQGVVPIVPMQQPSHTGDTALYSKARFTYDAATDTYRCPAGEVLRRCGSDARRQINRYRASACAGCALKPHCTRASARTIARSWYASACERAAQRATPRMMRLRAALVEHPFGTLKAMMPEGFLVRTLSKVRGEMALAVLTYNLKRVTKILGIDRFIQVIREATRPSYA